MGKLEEIEARAAAATPGPWALKEQAADEYWFRNGYLEVKPIDLPVGGTFDNYGAPIPKGHANAEFIARAREDIPYLITRVRLLEAALKGVEWKFDGWMSMKCPECDGSEPDHYDDCKIGEALRAELPTLTPSV